MKKGIDYPGITVVFLCHDGEGNYLMQKRSNQCRDEQGRWDCGTGSVDFGDSIEKTLKKEIKEEYCTEVLDHDLLGFVDILREHEGQKSHWLALCFRVLVDRKKAKIGEPNKTDEIGWFSIDKLPSPLHSQLPNTIKLYKDKL